MSEPEMQSHIYVLGEAEEPHGYVKIGVHYGKRSQLGRSGLTTGNWRKLNVLYHHSLPAEVVRWHEFVIHEHLRPWHKRGEWFDVRPLLSAFSGWDALLDCAYRREVAGGAEVDLGTPNHRLQVIRMTRWRPPREIVAEYSCGYSLQAEKTTLPTVYKRFLAAHCGHA